MYLMHENDPVCEISTICGQIIAITKIFNPVLLPIGTREKDNDALVPFLRSWQNERAIPFERNRLDIYTKYFQNGIQTAAQLGGGFSLTDHYWFKENNSSEKWEDLCFQLNGFSNQFADFFLRSISPFEEYHCPGMPDLHIPDITTDGILTKIWISTDFGAQLFKFGSVPHITEKNLLSANEVIAYQVGTLMDIDMVKYDSVILPQIAEPVCACKNFVPNDLEFITGLQLLKEGAGKGQLDLYKLLCNLGFKKQTDKMILLDFLLHNTDRHNKNYGILRDAKGLSPVCFAPIFDTGSCLNWNRQNDSSVKPFKTNRLTQLELIDNPFDVPEIQSILPILQNTYEFFEIPDEQYNIALDDLKNTYKILNNLSKEKQILVEKEAAQIEMPIIQ